MRADVQTLHVVCVQQTVDGEAEWHWLCLVCDAEEEEVQAALVDEKESGILPVCPKEWLRWRALSDDCQHGTASCECFISPP